MLWTQDALWAKAKSYMEKALAEDREGPEFPFFASLALEFLARATVASIHPALLADPQDANNLLYVFGLEPKKKKFIPKSIPTHTVFSRCTLIAPGFTEEDVEICQALAGRRNEELHSAGLPFEDFPTRVWQASFYRTCKKLLEVLKKSLEDFLGEQEAKAAEMMIEKADKRLISTVKSSIAARTKLFSEKPPREQDRLRKRAKIQAMVTRGMSGRVVECPACKCDAVLQGHLVQAQPPVLEENALVVKEVYLPIDVNCTACGLHLDTHSKLDVAGLGGQFVIDQAYDPVSYYGGINPEDVGPEYGND